jgi:hypothetical protein
MKIQDNKKLFVSNFDYDLQQFLAGSKTGSAE